MADSSFIGTIYTKIVQAFETPLGNYAQAIAAQVMPVFGAAFLLYVVWIIYRMYSKKDALFEEFTNYLILFAIVGLFIGGAGKYYSSVIPFVLNAGDDIASALSSTPGGSVSAVDTVYNVFQNAINIVDKKLDDSSWWSSFTGDNFDLLIAWLILSLAQLVFSVLITVNLLIAKIMVVLLLSVGVIFVAFSIFTATRNMFFSFVGLCFNYILLNVLYSVSSKLAADYIVDTVSFSPDGVALIANALQTLVTVLIMVLAINQIPTLVSSLTGGVGISAFTVSSHSVSNLLKSGGKQIAKAAGAISKAGYAAGNFVTKGGLDRAKSTMGGWKNRATGAIKDAYNSRTGRGSAGQ